MNFFCRNSIGSIAAAGVLQQPETIFGVNRMKIIVQNFAISADSRICTDINSLPRINCRT